MRLEGKKVLLTGGGGGLGTALGALLKERRAYVLTAGRSESEDIIADFGSEEGIKKFCSVLPEMPIDVLINNAGVQYYGRTHQQPDISVQTMVNVNLQAPLMITKTVLPRMLKQGSGKIVNIGSVFAGIPFPHFSTYCAVKAGLHAYSQSLRREYAQSGVHVTYVAPRALKTSMSSGVVAELLKRTRSAMDAPEKVARKIVRGIEKEKREVNIGYAEVFLSHLNELAPALVDQFMNHPRKIGEDLLRTHNHLSS